MMEKRRLANKPRLIRTTLVLIWLSLNILNLQIGLADNGDWIRVAAWFVTTPTGFEGKVIDNSSALYLIRYFNTWLPFWNIDFMFQGQILSSAILLWFPGVILNTLFFSPTILFLPWLSFVPRLMMLIILLAVFRWIETEANQKQIFYLTLALPLDLVFSTTDYIAYFNTFYQETAAFVGLFFFLGSLYWVQIHYSFLRLSFFIVSASFLILSRSSLIYFAILALVFLVPVFKKQRLWHFIVTSLVLIGVAGLNIGLTSDANMRKMNAFNAIYTGILPFSRHLEEQLINHSLYGSHICIDDIDYFSVARAWCASNYASQINSQTGVRILLDEPAILFRQILFVSSVMQQLNLDNSEYPFFNLNNFAPGVDRSSWNPWLNIWSQLKSTLFPRDWALIVAIPIFAIVFIYLQKLAGTQHVTISFLSNLGIMLLVSLLIDMLVVINGDGKYEITKHLYVSNLLFDLSLLLAINLPILWITTTHPKPSTL